MSNFNYEKYEKAGMVAVLISSGYGAGWYSWNTDYKGMLFDKDICLLLENCNEYNLEYKVTTLCEKRYPSAYLGGLRDLKIVWLPVGSRFIVDEYDGSESIELLDQTEYHVA